MMQQDKLKAAEAFIDKVIAPARAARKPEAEAIRARTALAHEDVEAAREALKASGIDPKALDKLAAERSTAGRSWPKNRIEGRWTPRLPRRGASKT